MRKCIPYIVLLVFLVVSLLWVSDTNPSLHTLKATIIYCIYLFGTVFVVMVS